MSDHADHPVDFLPELALGVLEPEEAARVRAILDECLVCAAEFALITSAVDLLPMASEPGEPSASVREAVLSRIANEKPGAAPAKEPVRFPVERTRPGWTRWAMGAAAAVVLAVGGGLAGFALNSGDSAADPRDVAVVEAAGRGDLEVARFQDGEMRATLVRAPGHSNGFIWVENLPALPEGKEYQAWFTEDFQDFEPSDTFATADGGQWLSANADIDGYLAMGLTIEDEGGVDAPTQAPFVVVELQRSAKANEVPSFMRAAVSP